METIILVVSLLSLATNLFLVRHITKNKVVVPAPQNLPEVSLEDVKKVWEDMVERIAPTAAAPTPIPTPTPGGPEDSLAWVNRQGIEPSSNVAPPEPPIQRVILPPLARPAGFV